MLNRNGITEEKHKLLKKITKTTEEQGEEIEREKNSTRIDHAIRPLQWSNSKKTLLKGLNGIGGIPTNELEIITKHFKDVFHVNYENEIQKQRPTYSKESYKRLKSLKNNREEDI